MAVREPSLGFAVARDGLRIAFSRHGRGPPLVFVRGWIGQLDIFWSDPEYHAFFERLGDHFTVYRFDSRGNGLSGREASDYSWPALISDLEAVVEHESLDRFCLWGSTFGAVIAVRYAVQNPARVSSLVLDGAYTRGWEISSLPRRTLLLKALQHFPEMAIVLLGHATSPTPHMAAYRRPEIVQQMIAPRTAAKLYALAFKADLTNDLPQLSMPTLVLHRRNSQSIPFFLGRAAAGLIPDARFVPLEGTAHNLWEENPTGSLKAMLEFLGVPSSAVADVVLGEAADPSAPQRKLVAVLYADVAGYTHKMEMDEAGTHERLLERLTILRAFVSRYGGRVHYQAGDALMVEFPSASSAVDCAVLFQAKAAELNGRLPEEHHVDFRIGVHLGDVIADHQTLYGTAINLAQRLESISFPGGICVSGSVFEAVHHLLPYHFEFVGEKSLKHLSSPVGAYYVFGAHSSSPAQSDDNVIGMILPH